MDSQGEVRTIANLAGYKLENNPDPDQHYGFGPDIPAECLAGWPAFLPARYQGALGSHPYGVAVRGDTAYVADAGAKAILEVNIETDDVSTLAVLPPRPAVIPAGTKITVDMPGTAVEVPEIDAWTCDKSQFLAIDGPAAVELRGQSLYATAGFNSVDLSKVKVIKAGIR